MPMSQYDTPIHYESFADYPVYDGSDLEVNYTRAKTTFKL